MRPHFDAFVARAEGNPDEGVGDGHCDDIIRESSAVSTNFAGVCLCVVVVVGRVAYV